MSGLYKSAKPFAPKPKSPKRKRVKESVAEQNIALLRQKFNLNKPNIADEFLDIETRDKKLLQRAIELADLHPFEILMRLAATELHLETTLFLYDETYKQKQFLEAAYIKSGEKRLIDAANRAAGKARVQNKYLHIKEIAQHILQNMQRKDFRMFCRKIRVNFKSSEISDRTLSNYFKDITGLSSTK